MPFGLQVIGRYARRSRAARRRHAMEQAFERNPALKRPRPDLAKLTKPTPELKSIVTHPPKRSEMG